MLNDPLLLLAAFVLAVVCGRWMQGSYAAGTAALANRLRPGREAPADAAQRLRGDDAAAPPHGAAASR